MKKIFVACAALGLGAVLPSSPAAPQAPIPDFSGIWWHPSLPGFEPLAVGATAVTNRVRRDGVSDYGQLVGDYTNPILKPAAAATVKQYGEDRKSTRLNSSHT